MAGRIPQSFIDDLLGRVDIVELVESEVSLKKTGSHFTACCPFHQEKTPSFVVFPKNQNYHCFGCGAHGDAISFLRERQNLGYVECIEVLAQRLGVQVPNHEVDPTVTAHRQSGFEAMESARKFYQKQLRVHPKGASVIAYLKGRGVSGEIARDFALGFAPPGWESLRSVFGTQSGSRNTLVETGLQVKNKEGRQYDRFRNRLIFPIRDKRGRTIGFGGRVLDDETPKYLNSPETELFHKGRHLYGLYEVLAATRSPKQFIVVEGYMDVIALHQFGFRTAVGTLGTALTMDQARLLFRHAPKVVFCFDGDRAGERAAFRALTQIFSVIEDGLQASFMFLPSGEDPDSLLRASGADGFAARLQNAMPFVEYFLEKMAEGLSGEAVDQRVAFIKRALPFIKQLPEGLFKDMVMADISKRLAVPLELVLRHVSALAEAKTLPNRDEKLSDALPALEYQLIMMLMLRPDLRVGIDNPALLDDLEDTPSALLREWIAGLNAGQDTETLLDSISGVETKQLLRDIYAQRHRFSGAGLQQEFRDAWARLAKKARKVRTRVLSQKAALTVDEKQELQKLVKEGSLGL